VRGVTDVFMFRSIGQPNIVVEPDRAAASRYGLNSGDVAAIVQAAIGGQAVTQVLEGDRRFDLVVRWKLSSFLLRKGMKETHNFV
jgi:cobalt-zinc-cadmium resistance protein CzcA